MGQMVLRLLALAPLPQMLDCPCNMKLMRQGPPFVSWMAGRSVLHHVTADGQCLSKFLCFKHTLTEKLSTAGALVRAFRHHAPAVDLFDVEAPVAADAKARQLVGLQSRRAGERKNSLPHRRFFVRWRTPPATDYLQGGGTCKKSPVLRCRRRQRMKYSAN